MCLSRAVAARRRRRPFRRGWPCGAPPRRDWRPRDDRPGASLVVRCRASFPHPSTQQTPLPMCVRRAVDTTPPRKTVSCCARPPRRCAQLLLDEGGAPLGAVEQSARMRTPLHCAAEFNQARTMHHHPCIIVSRGQNRTPSQNHPRGAVSSPGVGKPPTRWLICDTRRRPPRTPPRTPHPAPLGAHRLEPRDARRVDRGARRRRRDRARDRDGEAVARVRDGAQRPQGGWALIDHSQVADYNYTHSAVACGGWRRWLPSSPLHTTHRITL